MRDTHSTRDVCMGIYVESKRFEAGCDQCDCLLGCQRCFFKIRARLAPLCSKYDQHRPMADERSGFCLRQIDMPRHAGVSLVGSDALPSEAGDQAGSHTQKSAWHAIAVGGLHAKHNVASKRRGRDLFWMYRSKQL